jgi:WD40 repeat protein
MNISPISGVTFSPKHNVVVVSRFEENGFENGLYLYDVKSANLLRKIKMVVGEMLGDMVFSPDGRLLVTTHGTTIARPKAMHKIWSTKTGQALRSLPGFMYGATPAFSKNGSMLATDGNKVINVWNPENGKLIRKLQHLDRATASAFSTDGKQLAAGFDDSTVRIWQLS